MTGKKRYSIREIAEAAGVAPSTVSRVLNQSDYVAPETEKRVREVIAKVGYAPSQIARGLRIGSSPIIGILTPDVMGEFFTYFSMELHSALVRHAYIPVLVNTSAIADVEAECNRIHNALNPSGWVRVIIPPHPDRPPVPTAYVDYSYGPEMRAKEVSVCSDGVQIGYLATRELIERGCKHIATLQYTRIPNVPNSRYTGYQNALRDAGIAEEPDLVFDCDGISYEEGYAYTKRLLEARPDMDGIFCMADRYVPGVLKALEEGGRRVPEDVKVIGCDDSPLSRYVHGGFSTIDRHIDQMAEATAAALAAVIAGQPAENVSIAADLVRRQTT